MKSSLSLVTLTALSLLGTAACADVDADGTASDDVRATPQLLCASSADELVYYGDESQVLLEANVSRDGKMTAASLTMPGNDKLGVRGETWEAQAKYTPRNPTYQGMQKYSSADAWCGYSVIAPTDLNGKKTAFEVYVQQSCEGGFNSTATLSCKVVSKKSPKPVPEAAAATVELRYSADGKGAAIATGYFTDEQFTGNSVVIDSSATSIDIDNVTPDPDADDSPLEVCYTGDVTGAKKILWALLGNTDGNGDHWLDEGATIEAGAAGLLRVEYSVTGEGGSNPASLDVPVCE